MSFDIKDSGKRDTYAGGMQRDTTEGKTDYSLILDGPMFQRWAEHLTKGAQKYEKRNWMKANGIEEQDRFKESALRHFLQWYRGEEDEDHASAVFFNINGAEYVKARATQAYTATKTPTMWKAVKNGDVLWKTAEGWNVLHGCKCPGCMKARGDA